MERDGEGLIRRRWAGRALQHTENLLAAWLGDVYEGGRKGGRGGHSGSCNSTVMATRRRIALIWRE